jgi:ATP-dependent Lhr-like helicase
MLALIEQLECFEAPAGHWEKYLLNARMESYDSSWLDNLTFSGQVAWGRIRAPASAQANNANGSGNGRPMKALTRSTPITLMLRDHVGWLLPAAEEPIGGVGPPEAPNSLGSNARAAYEAFLRHGALFPAQIATLLQLVPSQVEDVLGELAAAGLVTSDGYPALRNLIGTGASTSRRSSRRPTSSRSSGRSTLLRSPLTPAIESSERTEHWCRLLLRRYGVMFRDLLANESAAPTWQELVRTYRRLEARGEIRGGRFVAEVAGEQYAVAEVIPMLRAADATDERPLALPATDPLNLTGRVGDGARVPALPGHFIIIFNGEEKVHEPSLRFNVSETSFGEPIKSYSPSSAVAGDQANW